MTTKNLQYQHNQKYKAKGDLLPARNCNRSAVTDSKTTETVSF